MSSEQRLKRVNTRGNKKRYVVTKRKAQRRVDERWGDSRYFVVPRHGEKMDGYFGSILWQDENTLLGAVYEPGTDGAMAKSYLSIPKAFRKRTIRLHRLWRLKALWHQLNVCECASYSVRRCPASGRKQYDGPTLATSEFASIPYLDVHADDLCGDEIDFISRRWRHVERAVKLPHHRQAMLDAFNRAGGWEPHRERFLEDCRSYVGQWYDILDEEGVPAGKAKIIGYDQESDEYFCERYAAGATGEDSYSVSMENGSDVRIGKAFQSGRPVSHDEDSWGRPL